jgi:hypothetical protein
MFSKSSAAGKVQRVRIKPEHALDAGIPLIFLKELASFRSRNPFFNGGEEIGFLVQIAY